MPKAQNAPHDELVVYNIKQERPMRVDKSELNSNSEIRSKELLTPGLLCEMHKMPPHDRGILQALS